MPNRLDAAAGDFSLETSDGDIFSSCEDGLKNVGYVPEHDTDDGGIEKASEDKAVGHRVPTACHCLRHSLRNRLLVHPHASPSSTSSSEPISTDVLRNCVVCVTATAIPQLSRSSSA